MGVLPLKETSGQPHPSSRLLGNVVIVAITLKSVKSAKTMWRSLAVFVIESHSHVLGELATGLFDIPRPDDQSNGEGTQVRPISRTPLDEPNDTKRHKPPLTPFPPPVSTTEAYDFSVLI